MSSLSDFAGDYALDVGASDKPDAFLAALGVSFLVRKLASGLQVRQTISLDGDSLCIDNESGVGQSRVVYPVNKGLQQVVVNDEPVPTKTLFVPTNDFPLEIIGAVPKLKGTTTDRRRILKDGSMEQLIQLQTPESTVLMRRLFRRTSPPPPPRPASLVVSKPIPVSSPSTVAPAMAANASLSGAPSLLSLVSVNKENAPWPEIALLLGFGFASLSWSAWDCIAWLALAAVARFGAMEFSEAQREWVLALLALFLLSRAFAHDWTLNLPAIGLGILAYGFARRRQTGSPLTSLSEPDKKLLASWTFFAAMSAMWSVLDTCAWTAAAVFLGTTGSGKHNFVLAPLSWLFAATRLAFNVSAEAQPAMMIGSWTIMLGLLAGTRGASPLLSRRVVTPEQRFVELAASLVAVTLAYSPADGLASALASGALYLALRYLLVSEPPPKHEPSSSSAAEAPVASGAAAAAVPASKELKVHVTDSRKHASGHAEFLVTVTRAGRTNSCWRRYSALLQLRDDVAALYQTKRLGQLPNFPPKRWAGKSLAVIQERVAALDAFFSALEITPDVEAVLAEHLDMDPTVKNDYLRSVCTLCMARDACLEAATVGVGLGWVTAGSPNEYVRKTSTDAWVGEKSTALINRPASFVVGFCADIKNRQAWDVKAELGCVQTLQMALERDALGPEFEAPRPATMQRLVSEASVLSPDVLVCDTVGTTLAAPRVKMYVEATSQPLPGHVQVLCSGVVAVPVTPQSCIVTVVHLSSRRFAHGRQSAQRLKEAVERVASSA